MTDNGTTYITILRERYFIIVMDIVCIGHIGIYLACNVHHIIHSFILVMDIIFIGHITSYVSHNVPHILHIYSSSVNY